MKEIILFVFQVTQLISKIGQYNISSNFYTNYLVPLKHELK